MRAGFIFSDTFEINIGVIDEIINGEKLKKAAIAVNIKDFINSMLLFEADIKEKVNIDLIK